MVINSELIIQLVTRVIKSTHLTDGVVWHHNHMVVEEGGGALSLKSSFNLSEHVLQ